VAHEGHPDALPRWIRLQEEEFIGHVHRWLNLNQWNDALDALEDLGMTREALRDNLQRVLSGEICDARVFAPRLVGASNG
jgi:hypothetical protein